MKILVKVIYKKVLAVHDLIQVLVRRFCGDPIEKCRQRP